VIPYYIKLQKQRSQSNIAGVLNWLLPLSPVIVLGTFTNGDTLAFIMYIGFFGLLYNIGQLPLFRRQKLRRNGHAIIGSLGTIFLLTVLTFEWFWKDSIKESHSQVEVLMTAVLFLAGTAVLGYLHFKKQLRPFCHPYWYSKE